MCLDEECVGQNVWGWNVEMLGSIECGDKRCVMLEGVLSYRMN